MSGFGRWFLHEIGASPLVDRFEVEFGERGHAVVVGSDWRDRPCSVRTGGRADCLENFNIGSNRDAEV